MVFYKDYCMYTGWPLKSPRWRGLVDMTKRYSGPDLNNNENTWKFNNACDERKCLSVLLSAKVNHLLCIILYSVMFGQLVLLQLN